MRTLCITEAKFNEICKGPKDNIWLQILLKQERVFFVASAANNKIDTNNKFLQVLHQAQIQFKSKSNKLKMINNNPLIIQDFDDSVLLLDIDENKAQEICRDYGVALFSTNSANDPYIADAGLDVDVYDKSVKKDWSFVYEGVVRNCSSILIIDRYFFCREWDKGNERPDDTIDDAKYNLKSILDNVLPPDCKDDIVTVTLIFSIEKAIKDYKLDSNGMRIINSTTGKPEFEYYTFEEVVNIIEDVKKSVYREYSYDMEVLCINRECEYYNDTHDRYIITNYHILTSTQKMVAFTPTEDYLHNGSLYFRYIYSSLRQNPRSTIPAITKEKATISLKKLITNTRDFLIGYAINGSVMPFRKDCIKNKLLKITII